MNKKVIGLMKDELGGRIMIELVAVIPKKYSYLMDDGSENKKAKGTKYIICDKKKNFNHYDDCLLNNKSIIQLQQRFKSEADNVYT